MTYGPNPIAAEASRKALVENDRLDANHNDAAASRASLDVEELRDLERTLYVSPAGATVTETTPAGTGPVARRRSLLDRLFRRGR